MQMRIQEMPIDKVIPYENNPRVNDQAVDAVAASIKEFGFRTPILCDGEGVIIAGHTRLKAAKKLGLKTVPVIVADDLPPSKVQALRIADNQLSTLATWDESLLEIELSALQSADYDLSVLGFDEEELARLLAGDSGEADEDEEVTPTELASVKPEALSIIEESDRVVLQFSGGKDSTVAINWTRGVCEKLGKPLEAVFCETGAEFPDLTAHVIRVCERLGVKLVLLHPRENILAHYMAKREWPNSIFRDCLHKFINDPVNRHLRQYEGEKVICVRGGRSDQKTSVSKSDIYQEVKDGNRVVRLLNPFFGVDKTEYERALEGVKPLLWRGYELGFIRTACWMCPFQKVDQWETLKQHYPMLWEEMRRLAGELEYKKFEGDSTRRRFTEYWKKQQ
jgi:3'-phosphoadenosine 5'-phosphosulfate sulfotransferase (PAPS reductase)/FAD synthetase